jgi:hypothetical protein
MKQLQHYTTKFKMPHLYLEDLKSIEEIFTGKLHVTDFKFEFGEYSHTIESNGSDDLPKNQSFNRLSISAMAGEGQYSDRSWVSLQLTSIDAELRVHNPDLITRGAVDELKEVLVKSERKLLWLIFAPSSFISGAGISLFLLVAFLFPRQQTLLDLTILTLSISWGVIGWYITLKHYSLIETRAKKSFFARRKDEIAGIGIIGTLLIGLITLVITMLKK